MFALYFSCLHAFIREWPAHTRVSKNRPKHQDSRGKRVTFTERYCCWDQVKFVWRDELLYAANQYDFQYSTNQMRDSFDFFLNLQNLNTFKAREFEWDRVGKFKSLVMCARRGKETEPSLYRLRKNLGNNTETVEKSTPVRVSYSWQIEVEVWWLMYSFAKAPKVQESKSLVRQTNAVQLSKPSGALWWKFYIRGKP